MLFCLKTGLVLGMKESYALHIWRSRSELLGTLASSSRSWHGESAKLAWASEKAPPVSAGKKYTRVCDGGIAHEKVSGSTCSLKKLGLTLSEVEHCCL